MTISQETTEVIINNRKTFHSLSPEVTGNYGVKFSICTV